MKKKILAWLAIIVVIIFASQLYVMPATSRTDGIAIGNDLTIVIGTEVHATGVADYTCDGVADDVQFQAALDALPAGGGKLIALSGSYTFSATVTRVIDNVTIEGVGQATSFSYDASTPLFTAGGNNWVFSDFTTDAGGVNTGATTGWTKENLTEGSAYVALQVSGNITVSSNGTYSLGSDLLRWKEIFVAGGSIYLGDVILTDDEGCLATNEIHLHGNETLGIAGYVKMGFGTAPTHFEAGHISLWVDSSEKLYFQKADGTDIEIPLTANAGGSSINKVTGWLEGGQITISGGDNTKIDVSAGSILVITGTDNPIGNVISWTAQTALDPALATRSTWVGVKDDGAGNAEFVFDTEFDAIERRTTAILGRIWNNAGTQPIVTSVGDYERPAWGLLTAFQDFILEYGSWNISGNVYSANGINLLLDKSSGKSFRYHAEDTIGQENVHTDASQSPRSSYAYHLQGVGTTTTETDIDPDNYDNAGVKTALANNKWTVQEVWFFPVSGTCHVLYGQAIYSSKTEAIAAISTESKVRNTGILSGAIRRAYLVLEKGAIDLTDTSKAEIREHTGAGGGGGGGSVLWTKIGTILSPTATGDDVVLPTGSTLSIADMTTGSIPFIGASGLLSQDNANLFWDDTNNRIGIGTVTPNATFHIKANTPGTVGNNPAGQIIIQNPANSVYANAAITGYESDADGNPDQQLWYLGSSSGSNSDITFLNRRNSKLHLGTAGSVKMTILGDGKVGIGTTSPSAILDVANTDIDIAPELRLKRIDTSIEDTNALGAVYFTGTDGGSEAAPQIGAGIIAWAAESWATGDFGTDLDFYTADIGSSTLTRRMRINSSGNIGIGASTIPLDGFPKDFTAGGTLLEIGDGTKDSGITLRSRTSAGNAFDIWQDYGNINLYIDSRRDDDSCYIRFRTKTNATPVNALTIFSSGEIDAPGVYAETTASAANVVVASDGSLRRSTSSRKIKENINYEGVDPSLALQFKPVSFDEISTGNPYLGFIAEDMRDIDSRFAIDGGEEDLPGLDLNAIVATLTALVQEHEARIEALEVR